MVEMVSIIDVGSGNLRSVEKSLERAARESGIAAAFRVTADPDLVRKADRVVLPGVGAFRSCMDGLTALPGMVEALEHVALVEGRPFLGICVGMQMLADEGLEFGGAAGLGWIAGSVKALAPSPQRRIPHIGWNSVRFRSRHPVFERCANEDDFYFVHSFHFDVENNSHLVGVCDYDGQIAAVVARDNIVGVQFHPEKSQAAGLSLLAGFLGWRP